MTTTRSRFGALLASFAAAVTLTAAAAPADLHLKLDKAQPPIDGTVTKAPTSIRLFFSESPHAKLTTITVTDAAEAEIALGDVKLDRADKTIAWAPIRMAIASGTYTVTWRTMADDSHVVNGAFHFTVRPAQ